MKYLMNFELFEAAKSLRDKFTDEYLDKLNYKKPEIVDDPDIIKNSNNPNYYKIRISDSLSYDNRFKMVYNPEVNIILNDNVNHELFSNKRIFGLTWLDDKYEFLLLLKNAFNKIYPEYFFKGVKNINDIDLYDPNCYDASNLSKSSKVYSLHITREYREDFNIRYTLGKKYNIKEKKYDIYIFIITVHYGDDVNRIYQVYNFEYEQTTNNLIFKGSDYIGVNNLHFATDNIRKYIIETFKKEDEIRDIDIKNRNKANTAYLDKINRNPKSAISDNLKKTLKINKKI